jgi:hypothetical protein
MPEKRIKHRTKHSQDSPIVDLHTRTRNLGLVLESVRIDFASVIGGFGDQIGMVHRNTPGLTICQRQITAGSAVDHV